jgi:hypothetical protein
MLQPTYTMGPWRTLLLKQHITEYNKMRKKKEKPGLYPCGDRPLSRLGGKFPPSLDKGRSPHGYINQRLQIQFGAPDDERYAARNMLSLQ